MWKTRKERKRKNKEQGRTLSRQNFHPNQNELRRDHKSHKGKSNETTTGYKSLWCFGPYGPPTETCVHRIYPRRKWNSSFADSGGGRREVNEHRLHREMEPSEKASCSINVWTILVVRSVRSVILRTSWKISEKRRKKKKWEIVIYDLLRAPDLRLTSTSNEIYATWLSASFCTFVFCSSLVTLEDFPQIKIFFNGWKVW